MHFTLREVQPLDLALAARQSAETGSVVTMAMRRLAFSD